MKKANTLQEKGEIIPFIIDGNYFFNKGIKAYRNHQLDKAKKYLEKAVAIDQHDPVFVCQLAIVLAELGDYTRSNEYLEEVCEKEPMLTDCYYFLANNYAHLGLFQEAKKYATKYIETTPDGMYIEDTYELLDILEIEIYDDGTELPDELIILQEQACHLLERGKSEEALPLFQQLTEKYPEFWSAHNNLALAYFYLGNVDKALQVVNHVLEHNEGNIHALCNLAIFYYYMNKHEQVNNISEQLKKVYPIDDDHKMKLGTTLALITEYQYAYRWLQRLYRKKFEGNPSFYYWLAIAAYHVGAVEEAKAVWEKVLALLPDKKGKEPWKSE